MDYATITLLITAGIIVLLILVLAASILSARSFTQLAALIASLGSLLERLIVETRQVQTTSLTETERGIASAQQDITPITLDKAD